MAYKVISFNAKMPNYMCDWNVELTIYGEIISFKF